MRSLPKDSRRITTVHTVNTVPSAATGNDIFSDGTPWHSIRTVDPGRFEVYFDSRLVPITAIACGPTDSRVFYVITSMSPGVIAVTTRLYDATLTNAQFDLTVTWLDTRL